MDNKYSDVKVPGMTNLHSNKVTVFWDGIPYILG